MRKFYQTKEFKKLNLEWKKKLEAVGFEDLEDENGRLKEHRCYPRGIAFQNQERISTFFSALGEFLSTEKLRRRDRRILELFCQGSRIQGKDSIAEKTGLHRDTVLVIINKYKQIVIERMR